ncbi:MAG: CPBP family intramembrane glutamic endopeptidase [Nannocystales bacterium]
MDTDTAGRRLAGFFALACGITWGLAFPAVETMRRGGTATPIEMALLGLSAFGPLLSTLVITIGTGERRDVFGPWRVRPQWIVLALLFPWFLQLIGRALSLGGGGPTGEWIYLPDTPAYLTALVVFPLGEEFGWRGYAQPRMIARFGAVRGPLLLGCIWSIWHLMYLVSPQSGTVEPVALVMFAALPLWSVVFAWLMRCAGGSMAVALCLHAGSHLDKIDRLPVDAVSTRVTIATVTAVAGLAAAFALHRETQSSGTGREPSHS